MRPDLVRFMTVALPIVLLSGCAGAGINAEQLPTDELTSVSDASAGRHSERRPRTSFETSLSHGDGLTIGTARVSAAAMLPINPPEKMLLVKPYFTAYSLDAPLDTPSSLYSAVATSELFPPLVSNGLPMKIGMSL